MRELTARCSDLSIDFGIFALEPAKAPQLDKQHQANAREIGAIERKLQEIDPHSSLRKEDLLSGLLILPPSDTDDFGHHNGMMTEQLVELRTDLIQKQKAIEMEKDNLFNEESRKALELARNRHDYEPFILTMATMVWAQQQAEAKTIKPKKKGRKGR
jgi:ubiquitin carboxyl-terminal hydrolase L5